MPEYPEIHHLAVQMDAALRGKSIVDAQVNQPKCLNLDPEDFCRVVTGRTLTGAWSRGKWVFLGLHDGARLALNLNMGGNVVLHAAGEPLREKWRVALRFADGTALSIGFWFLGYLHHIAADAPHPLTDGLGADPMADGFTFEEFDRILGQRKTAVKSILLRQDLLCGIGNFYAQDLFYLARIHPMRPVHTLTTQERRRLYDVLRDYLGRARDLGGAWYERGLDDQPGGYGEEQLLVGYREGKPCPACGQPIQKIKTGSTSAFVCTQCQPEKV